MLNGTILPPVDRQAQQRSAMVSLRAASLVRNIELSMRLLRQAAEFSTDVPREMCEA